MYKEDPLDMDYDEDDLVCVAEPSAFRISCRMVLRNVAELTSMKSGQSISSPQFSDPQHPMVVFTIKVYPNGCDDRSAGNVYAAAVTSKGSWLTIDQSWSLLCRGVAKRWTAKKTESFTMGDIGSILIAPHSQVKELMALGEIAVRCELFVQTSVTARKVVLPEKRTTPGIDRFYDNDITDCVLRCVNKNKLIRDLKAHRLILADASAVFHRMFSAETQERSTGVIEITDVRGDIVKMMLEHIYCVPEPTTPVDIETWLELLKVADKYEISALLEECQRHLMLHTDETNVCAMLLAADTYAAPLLLEHASDMLAPRLSLLVRQPDWLAANGKHLTAVAAVLEQVGRKQPVSRESSSTESTDKST